MFVNKVANSLLFTIRLFAGPLDYLKRCTYPDLAMFAVKNADVHCYVQPCGDVTSLGHNISQQPPDNSILHRKHTEQVQSMDFCVEVKEVTVKEFMSLEAARKEKAKMSLLSAKVVSPRPNTDCVKQAVSQMAQLDNTFLLESRGYMEPARPLKSISLNKPNILMDPKYRKLLKDPEKFRRFKLALEKKIQSNPQIARPAVKQMKMILKNNDAPTLCQQ